MALSGPLKLTVEEKAKFVVIAKITDKSARQAELSKLDPSEKIKFSEWLQELQRAKQLRQMESSLAEKKRQLAELQERQVELATQEQYIISNYGRETVGDLRGITVATDDQSLSNRITKKF